MFIDSQAVSTNPFAALTAVVAPAILTNACSVLALGTSNRLGRVVDRTRVVATEIASLERDTPGYRGWVAQRERLDKRAQLLLKALRSFYAALGLFISAALLAIVGSAAAAYGWQAAYQVVIATALGVGALAVSAVVMGSVATVREARLAVENLREEAKLRS